MREEYLQFISLNWVWWGVYRGSRREEKSWERVQISSMSVFVLVN